MVRLQMLMFARHTTRFVARWIVAGLLLSGPVFAQPTIPKPPSQAEQEKLYQKLAREVEQIERYGNVVKTVVKLIKPTVVHIEAQKAADRGGFYDHGRSVEEAGSGVLVKLHGKYYVLTNRHVIDRASLEDVKINLADGRSIHPTQVWSDPGTDVAVMAVSAPNLIAARLGNSDNVEIGDFVLAVGSPFGLSHSVTYGIISAKGRRDLKLGHDAVRYQDFMQTDAAINPGNSGGPLINLRGEVIGINTAIASSSGGNEGIGFTIPINIVKLISGQLVDRGSVARAFFGVRLDSQFSLASAKRLGLPRSVGARVTGITPKSPAESIKMQADDVILKFDGRQVEDDNHLINIVSLTQVEKEVEVVIFRDGKEVTVRVKVGDKSKFSSDR